MNTSAEYLNLITPIILTYNEEANIDRTLSKLTWASRIVVIDSYSDDKTLDILARYPRVIVMQRKFDSFREQSNYGLNQVETPWVLSLDADYVVSDALIEEMATMIRGNVYNGYSIPLIFCIDGVPLQCSILPPRVSLFRKTKGCYYQDGHAHRLRVLGRVSRFRNPIFHDDRKPYSVWIRAQHKYAAQEAEKLFDQSFGQLKVVDKIRKLVILMPVIMPIYILLFKRGVLDWNRGFYYAYLRTYYELLLAGMVLKGYLGPFFCRSHAANMRGM